jgi:hypothetical protein
VYLKSVCSSPIPLKHKINLKNFVEAIVDIIKIVARYSDGRFLKGYTHDFFPNKPVFHLKSIFNGKIVEVHLQDLKAVFFVRDFIGSPSHNEVKHFTGGQNPSGRKVEVTFKDGEIIVGSTMGYDPKRPGFFLFPPDPQSNNLKIFVISTSVSKVRYL